MFIFNRQEVLLVVNWCDFFFVAGLMIREFLGTLCSSKLGWRRICFVSTGWWQVRRL